MQAVSLISLNLAWNKSCNPLTEKFYTITNNKTAAPLRVGLRDFLKQSNF